MDKIFNTFYKITNLINGKYYYGVHRTKNLNDSYLGSGKLIRQAVKKYGKENFVKEVLCLFNTYEESLKFESEFITGNLLTDPLCYNLTEGGKGWFGDGRPSPSLGRKASPETIDKLIKSHTGKKQSQETIDKRKQTIKESGVSCANKNPNTWWMGKHIGDATKQKLREANLGKKYSDEINKKKGRKGDRPSLKYRREKPILQFDLNGNFIKEWEYIKQASDELSINYRLLRHCLKNKEKIFANFIWEYKRKISNVA